MNKSTKVNQYSIIAPSPGESINEIQISNWIVADGSTVKKDEIIAEIETEKASLEIVSEYNGKLKIIAQEGTTVNVGSEIAKIIADDSIKEEVITEKKIASVADDSIKEEVITEKKIASVAAEKLIKENNLDINTIVGTGHDGRITKNDIQLIIESKDSKVKDESTSKLEKAVESKPIILSEDKRTETRQSISMLRRKISERLVAVKNETAMLTTFNEVDLSNIIEARSLYKELFKEKFEVGLGFMSFFTVACATALKEYPIINSQISGSDIITYNYIDIGIAVSAPKGLMVPIIRNVDKLSMDQIESKIIELATKARNNSITIDEMTGGTFTITNGGVFGSMLSTPIINPPQSAILGMHNIVKRPVVIDDEIKIRPMMYLALSYDHRIVDGKDSVSFLNRIKTLLESPIRLLLNI